MTERGKYRFTVKEGKDGTPSLLFEPAGAQLDILKYRQLEIELSIGTTVHEARSLASALNVHMTGLALSQTLRVIK